MNPVAMTIINPRREHWLSNFSFSHNVFKSCLLLMRQNEYLWSKGLKKLCQFQFQNERKSPHSCSVVQEQSKNGLSLYQTTRFWTGPN